MNRLFPVCFMVVVPLFVLFVIWLIPYLITKNFWNGLLISVSVVALYYIIDFAIDSYRRYLESRESSLK